MPLTPQDRSELAKQSEAARKARSELASAEQNYEAEVDRLEKRITSLQNAGVKQVATMALIGAGAGGGTAYLTHDMLADYFGRATWPALLILPVAGVLTFAKTPSFFKDRGKKSLADERAMGYGAGVGLLLVGGYLSYEDYVAANP